MTQNLMINRTARKIFHKKKIIEIRIIIVEEIDKIEDQVVMAMAVVLTPILCLNMNLIHNMEQMKKEKTLIMTLVKKNF
jgi:hypothetical protein